MTIRQTLKTPVSIGAEIAYQQALVELIESELTWSRLPSSTIEEENSVERKVAEAAMSSAWDALTATIDTYVSRRVLEALKL